MRLRRAAGRAGLIDRDTTLLPDDLTLPLLWAGLLAAALGWTVPLPTRVWGAVAGYLSLWSVYWLFKLATGKEGMGYGDFKLLAALGAWLGWQMSADHAAVVGGRRGASASRMIAGAARCAKAATCRSARSSPAAASSCCWSAGDACSAGSAGPELHVGAMHAAARSA